MANSTSKQLSKKRPKLDRLLKVYVTEEEEIELKLKAEITDMSFSSFARAVLMEKQVKANPRELKRIRYELNKIGINLNQLARRANETDEPTGRKKRDSIRHENNHHPEANVALKYARQ